MKTYGNFSKDAKEFIIDSPDTPKSWVNYLCNRNGNNLYFWVKNWVGKTLVLSEIKTEVKNVRCLSNGELYKFDQTRTKLIISGLPYLVLILFGHENRMYRSVFDVPLWRYENPAS